MPRASLGGYITSPAAARRNLEANDDEWARVQGTGRGGNSGFLNLVAERIFDIIVLGGGNGSTECGGTMTTFPLFAMLDAGGPLAFG